MSNEIIEHDPSMTKSAIFNPTSLAKLQAFAEQMALSRVAIPSHLVGKPADCLAVALQAVQWGMNPYSVAQKTSVVNGGLCFEAQLVSAIVSSSNVISSRFKFEYAGPWDKYRPGERNPTAEKGLCVRVGAVLAGEKEKTWGEWLYLEFIKVRNSPLWTTNPKQQIAYLAVKYWARLHASDVILGVYTPEEFSPKTERDITPAGTPQSANDLNKVINDSVAMSSELIDKETRTPTEILESFTQASQRVTNTRDLDQCYEYAVAHLGEETDLLNSATDVYTKKHQSLTSK